MLGDDGLRAATDEQLAAAVDSGFDRLVDALLAETADSDDVFDSQSALRYADLRLAVLAEVLPSVLISRLRETVSTRLAEW
jgi:hypothetical protein